MEKDKYKRAFLEKQFYSQQIVEKGFYLASSRFTNNTWAENRKFCENYKKIIAYSCPIPISIKIPPDGFIGVLEMNNDINRIIGIGLIRNKTRPKTWVYEDGNYNRNTYFGTRRIDRSEMTEAEEKIMELLDSYCFKGNGHLKRGQGITCFPLKYLFESFERNVDILQEIKNMFNSRIKREEEKKENDTETEKKEEEKETNK